MTINFNPLAVSGARADSITSLQNSDRASQRTSIIAQPVFKTPNTRLPAFGSRAPRPAGSFPFKFFKVGIEQLTEGNPGRTRRALSETLEKAAKQHFNSSLHKTVRYGEAAALDNALVYADINKQSSSKHETILHSLERRYLRTPVETPHPRLADMLRSTLNFDRAGNSIDLSRRNHRGQTPLTDAVISHNYRFVSDLMAAVRRIHDSGGRTIDLTGANRQGLTPLHIATLNGDARMIQLLTSGVARQVQPLPASPNPGDDTRGLPVARNAHNLPELSRRSSNASNVVAATAASPATSRSSSTSGRSKTVKNADVASITSDRSATDIGSIHSAGSRKSNTGSAIRGSSAGAGFRGLHESGSIQVAHRDSDIASDSDHSISGGLIPGDMDSASATSAHTRNRAASRGADFDQIDRNSIALSQQPAARKRADAASGRVTPQTLSDAVDRVSAFSVRSGHISPGAASKASSTTSEFLLRQSNLSKLPGGSVAPPYDVDRWIREAREANRPSVSVASRRSSAASTASTTVTVATRQPTYDTEVLDPSSRDYQAAVAFVKQREELAGAQPGSDVRSNALRVAQMSVLPPSEEHAVSLMAPPPRQRKFREVDSDATRSTAPKFQDETTYFMATPFREQLRQVAEHLVLPRSFEKRGNAGPVRVDTSTWSTVPGTYQTIGDDAEPAVARKNAIARATPHMDWALRSPRIQISEG